MLAQMTAIDLPGLAQDFERRFGAAPRIAMAPGRINLIGEHTDYNDGLVLPAAIDRACFVAAAPADGSWSIAAPDVDAEADLARLDPAAMPTWARAMLGPALILAEEGAAPPGARLLVRSNVPMGMGMSSSAALIVAVTMAMLDLAGQMRSPIQIAHIARRAEREIVGVPCGLMDQFASTHGRAGAALFLDCRDLSWRPVAAPPDAAFAVFESGVRHALADSAYAERRAECERAARLLGAQTLREAEEADLSRLRVDPIAARRARHVMRENARVRAAIAALETGDIAALGALMNESHESLRDDFEATCKETDALADLARATPGVYGARQMGGGFGGGVLALVDRADLASAVAAITEHTGLPGYACTPGEGARMLAS
jgi:galactokinase